MQPNKLHFSATQNIYKSQSDFINIIEPVLQDKLLQDTIFEKQKLDFLIKKFAPILCFDAEEKNLPVSVEWYLKHAQLVKPNQDTKSPLTLSNFKLDKEKFQNYYLELNALKPKEKLENEAPSKVYVRVKAHHFEFIDLQYWFLFSGKGNNSTTIKWLVEGITGHKGAVNLNPIGCQGGHWECITVRINTQTQLVEKVLLPNTKEGTWFPFEKMQVKNNQIIVFVSKNNHSFYPSVGIKPLEILNYKLVSSILEFSLFDECSIDKIIDFSKSYELISNDSLDCISKEPDWLDYTGKWGNPTLQSLDIVSVNNILKAAFGPDLLFLLSDQILNQLSTYLISYHTTICKCKSLGPKNQKNWDRNIAD